MDKRGIPSFIALIFHVFSFVIYLMLLYNDVWIALYLKAAIYIIIASVMLFMVIDEWKGFDNYTQWQCNTINKCVFAANLFWSAMTVFEIFDAVCLMILYCIAIGITSIFILISSHRNNYFNNEDTH